MQTTGRPFAGTRGVRSRPRCVAVCARGAAPTVTLDWRHLIGNDLGSDVAQVQSSLTMLERQVEVNLADDTVTLLMRIHPYRKVDGLVDGVVITFIDINDITLANAERARFAALVRASGDAIVGLKLYGAFDTWSQGAEALFGDTPGEILGGICRFSCPPALKPNGIRF